jgi:hypothetical protein
VGCTISSCCCVEEHLHIVQGASKTFNLLVTAVDTGQAQNVDAPFQLWSTIKERHQDAMPLILKRSQSAGGAPGEITPIDPQTGFTTINNVQVPNLGRAQIYFLPTDTAKLKISRIYWIDVWGVNSGENKPLVKCRMIFIEPRVTHIPPT